MYNGDLNKVFSSFPFNYEETIEKMKMWARNYFHGRHLTPGKIVQVEPCKKYVKKGLVFEYTCKMYGGCVLDFTDLDRRKINEVVSCLEAELIQICQDEISRQPGLDLFRSNKYTETEEVIKSYFGSRNIEINLEAQKNGVKVFVSIQHNRSIRFFVRYKDRKDIDQLNAIFDSVIQFRNKVVNFGHEMTLR